MGKMKTTESKYDDEKKGFILKALQDASAEGLVVNGEINITEKILEKISFEDIFYALNHKEKFSGLLNDVNSIRINYDINDYHYESPKFIESRNFISDFAGNSSFKPKFIKIPTIDNDNIIALSIKTGINISCTLEKNSQKKVLIKALYDQIKENNVNNITQKELDQFVTKACNEAKSTDGFPMKHTHALRILSKFDFSEIDEEYSCIQKQLTNLYVKQKIISEYYHLQQEEGLHFYLVKVTGKNAEMWQKYANDERYESRKLYNDNNFVIKKAHNGTIAFLPSIDYHDQNDTWVAFVSNKQQDINNIDPKSIEMSVTMMTSEHAHFTSHVGISRGVSYTGIRHEELSCKLHSFIATATLQHYGDTVNKDYMITVPIRIMREILIKAFQGHDTDIFIGDNTTKCSEETLEILTKKFESMKKDDNLFNTTQRTLSIKQQQETLKKAEMTVPIKVTNGESSKECLNWVLRNKKDEILHDLKPQDMEGEYAWFFKSPWLWHNTIRVPAVTCNIEALADLGHFNTPFEHEYKVETIGGSYTLTELCDS